MTTSDLQGIALFLNSIYGTKVVGIKWLEWVNTYLVSKYKINEQLDKQVINI